LTFQDPNTSIISLNCSESPTLVLFNWLFRIHGNWYRIPRHCYNLLDCLCRIRTWKWTAGGTSWHQGMGARSSSFADSSWPRKRNDFTNKGRNIGHGCMVPQTWNHWLLHFRLHV
jgi:hypothetical protein